MAHDDEDGFGDGREHRFEGLPAEGTNGPIQDYITDWGTFEDALDYAQEVVDGRDIGRIQHALREVYVIENEDGEGATCYVIWDVESISP